MSASPKNLETPTVRVLADMVARCDHTTNRIYVTALDLLLADLVKKERNIEALKEDLIDLRASISQQQRQFG